MHRSIFVLMFMGLVLSGNTLRAGDEYHFTMYILGGQTMIGNEWFNSYTSLQGSDDRYEQVDYLDGPVYGIGLVRSKTFDHGYELQLGLEAMRISLDKHYLSDHWGQRYEFRFEDEYNNTGINVFLNNTYYLPLHSSKLRPFIGLGVVLGMGYTHEDSQSTIWAEQLQKDDVYYGLKPNVGVDVQVLERSWLQFSLEYRHDLTDLPLPIVAVTVGYKWTTDW